MANGDGPILVVEDERPLREMVLSVLNDEGFPTRGAVNGREALDAAAGCKPSLLLLDMALPILDGTAVARGLRALYGDTVPILLMTADGRAATKAEQIGAFGYLQKPFGIDALLAAVQEGLDQTESR